MESDQDQIVLEQKALRAISSALKAIERVGWTNPSIMLHGVDLRSMKEVMGNELYLESGLVQDTMSAYISAKLDGYEGLVLFNKTEKK